LALSYQVCLINVNHAIKESVYVFSLSRMGCMTFQFSGKSPSSALKNVQYFDYFLFIYVIHIEIIRL